MKDLRQRLLRGETLLGTWLTMGHALAAEAVGLAGFDWALIDLEHGAGVETEALAALQALAGTPTAGLVRVESQHRQRVQRVLDMGAEGIMFPRLQQPAEVRDAISAMRYPPDGTRGGAKNVRATGYSAARFNDYMAHYKEHQIGLVQIETLEVLSYLDEIAAIDGVDVLFVGPMDLSLALGAYGQPTHPRFAAAIRAVAEAARRAGKVPGVLLGTLDDFATYRDLGYRFIGCGSDGGYLADGAQTMAAAMKKMTNP